MNSKLKGLALALTAALALMAVMAASASAQLTSDKEHTIFSGSQEAVHTFSAGSGFGSISCEKVTVEGTGASKQTEELELIPSYSNCKDSLGRTVHPTITIRFRLTFRLFPPKLRLHFFQFHIIFHITSGGASVCTVTIGEQSEVNGISHHNLGGTSGIRITTNATNVKSTVEGGFFNCGTSTTSATAGTYTGSTVLTGKGTEGSAATISVD